MLKKTIVAYIALSTFLIGLIVSEALPHAAVSLVFFSGYTLLVILAGYMIFTERKASEEKETLSPYEEFLTGFNAQEVVKEMSGTELSELQVTKGQSPPERFIFRPTLKEARENNDFSKEAVEFYECANARFKKEVALFVKAQAEQKASLTKEELVEFNRILGPKGVFDRNPN